MARATPLYPARTVRHMSSPSAPPPPPPAQPADPRVAAPAARGPVSGPSAPAAAAAPSRGSAPATPTRPSITSPLRVAGAIAQLAALGVVGPIVFGGIFSLLGAGIAGAFFLGLGLVILVGLIYVLFAVAWLENARVDGLYRLGIPALSVRRPVRSGFPGVLGMFWRQAIDPSMWRALANFSIATILGVLVNFLLAIVSFGVILAFSPLLDPNGDDGPFSLFVEVPPEWAPVIGPLFALIALAVIVGLALLHGVLSRLILVPSREAQLSAEARQAGAQRAGAIRASEVERTRIERDLHDGVQPRLVSVGMTLGLAQQKIDDDPAAAKALVQEAHTSTKAAITELRQLARGIHASVLDDRGLDAALSALAARSHVPVQLDVRIDGRCERTAEAAVYFAIAESLTNAAKHSKASGVRVVIRRRDDGTLWARVEDDGIGGARILAGGGLDGIANRIAAAGGIFRLDSPNGGPTALEVSVPCAS